MLKPVATTLSVAFVEEAHSPIEWLDTQVVLTQDCPERIRTFYSPLPDVRRFFWASGSSAASASVPASVSGPTASASASTSALAASVRDASTVAGEPQVRAKPTSPKMVHPTESWKTKAFPIPLQLLRRLHVS